MRKSFKIWVFALLVALIIPMFGSKVQASDLDRILEYEITVDVNDDGTLHMIYNIEWKVLDSDSEGPLEWVKVGIPNKNYVSIKGLSDNIKKCKYFSESGSYVRVDFKKKYYRNEVVKFSF